MELWAGPGGRVAEENNAGDAGAQASGAPDTSGLALDLAMEEARRDPFHRSRVDAYFDRQIALAALQEHQLREQFAPQMRQTLLGVWEKRIGMALRAATLAVGLAVAGALGWMVWDAAHAQGLLIEPFTVPAELAARGLNGQAFSSMLLDKVTLLQAQTLSNRPGQSYANNWGNDLKVEIPETGVSLGELRRFLRQWLGRDTHISGEVWLGDKGLTITARASGGTGEPVTGPESDLDGLMLKAALNVYRVTQPYRYANYLDRDIFHPGFTDIPAAEAIYRRLVTDPNRVERAYAWNGLANLAWTVRGDNDAAIAYYRRAGETDPSYPGAPYGIAYLSAMHLSHPEAALAAARDYARIFTGEGATQWVNVLLGDYAAAMASNRRIVLQGVSGNVGRARSDAVRVLAQLHDGPGFREWLREMPVQPVTQARTNPSTPLFWIKLAADTDLQDWRRVLATEPEIETRFLESNPGWNVKDLIVRSLRPRLALAKAKLGDFPGAEAAIAPAPGDCYDCLRYRGQIASEAKQWGRADYWFARAAADAPSIPFAHEDWGRSLLARGKPDEAIAQFTLANKKGPHFADALEGWGEALAAKNQSHLALAKFAEAEKYAPNWGRLHLKWGQALAYAGKPEEARKQFARAAQLDLMPAEKSELQKYFPNRP